MTILGPGKITNEPAKLACSYCGRALHEAEIRYHAVSCAHERIANLEKTVAALANSVDLLRGALADAGIIEEFRP